MSTTPSLTTVLQQEHDTITGLLGLLEQEQALLVNADTDGLAALTPRKSELVLQLAALASQRHQQLAAAGFPASEDGMAPYLAAHPETSLAQQWQTLLAQTRSAKELNRVNGMLIGRHLAHNQGALNAMKRTAGDADATTYGPSGQTAAGGPSRRFVVG